MNTREGHEVSSYISLCLIPLRQTLSSEACCLGTADWPRAASSQGSSVSVPQVWPQVYRHACSCLAFFFNVGIGYREYSGLHARTVSHLMHWALSSGFFMFPSAEICVHLLVDLYKMKGSCTKPLPSKKLHLRKETTNSTRIGMDGGMIGNVKADTNLLTQSHLFWRLPPFKI